MRGSHLRGLLVGITLLAAVALGSAAVAAAGTDGGVIATMAGAAAVCPPDDGFEDNDDQASATPLTGPSINAIARGSDLDYYSFAVSTGEEITASLNHSHADGNLDLFLWRPDGPLAAQSVTSTDNEQIVHTATQTGEWAVLVAHQAGNADNEYSLSVTTAICPPDDGFEPNDGSFQATQLVSGVQVEAIICGVGFDYFQLQVTAGDRIRVDVLFDKPGTFMQAWLVAPPYANTDFVARVIAGQETVMEHDATQTGNYLVKIESISLASSTYSLTGTVGELFCDNLPVTVDLNVGDVPTSGDDVILGTPGPDVINALEGNDTVCAEEGADTVIGGPGEDTIFGGPGDDLISGNADNDELYGEGGKDRAFGGSGDDLVDGGQGNDIALGGSSGADTVLGGTGRDTLSGGSDADTEVNGGDQDDAVNGGGGNDTNVHGGAGNDTVSGNGGKDIVHGDDGDDEVRGGQADDQVFGDSGDDFLAGNDGTDTCDGGTTGETLGDTAAPNCETLIDIP